MISNTVDPFIKDKVCVMCGKPATFWEPRFNYTTCEEHKDIIPAIYTIGSNIKTINNFRDKE